MNKLKFILIMICSITCTQCTANDNSLKDQLVTDGYRYVIFGSQKTNGIELYDLKESRFIDFLSSKDDKVTYKSPVVNKTGTGFCIEERNTFEQMKRVSKLVAFDLRTMKFSNLDSEVIHNAYAVLTLSPDGQKIAYITSEKLVSSKITAYLTVFDTGKKQVEKRIVINNSYLENPTKIVWMPDNINIAIWTWHPAEVVNTATEQITSITDKFKMLSIPPYPIAFYKDKFIAVLDRNKKTMPTLILDTYTKKAQFLEDGVNDVKFTDDGKFIVSAIKNDWTGEFIRITSAGEFTRKYDIKLHDSGTVLGISIW